MQHNQGCADMCKPFTRAGRWLHTALDSTHQLGKGDADFCTERLREVDVALLFIGIDPNTGTDESPTVWVDQEKQELVLQGWKPDLETEAECAAFTVPGHATGIPDHEAVIRIPARMVPMIREACDVIERATVQ